MKMSPAQRDSSVAWASIRPTVRVQWCHLAGCPDAADVRIAAELTVSQRRQLVDSLRLPEVQAMLPEAIRWGLQQFPLE